MEKVGSRCELHLYEGQGHGFFNYRNYDFYKATVSEADKFLSSLGIIKSDQETDFFKDEISDNAGTVKIGNQSWMAKNLDVASYRNGDPIPRVNDPSEWAGLKTGAWCYYGNSPEIGETYGKLYNWYAVADPRGLAPEGFHVPIDEEWAVLVENLGGTDLAGVKLKSTNHWMEGPGTNASGFNALPVGGRSGFGAYARLGGYGRWWSSSGTGTEAALFLLHYFDHLTGRYATDSRSGFAVRCIKD